MDPQTAQRLLEINSQFYQTFAVEFDATRRRLQPGVRQVLEQIRPEASILDLGCGNGELWRALHSHGHTGVYLGLDLSPGLLEAAMTTITGARDQVPAVTTAGIQPILVQADLASPDWPTILPRQPLPPGMPPFDFILAFAVLHHLPGNLLRLQLMKQVQALLAPQGRFIHSHWQFLNSPRLRSRIQPWEAAGLSSDQVDPGDYLLDWRSGGSGLRYVHHFTQEELASLAEKSGFRLVSSFASDGESGDLSLYQVWQSLPGIDR